MFAEYFSVASHLFLQDWPLLPPMYISDLLRNKNLEQQVICLGHCPPTMFFTSRGADADKTYLTSEKQLSQNRIMSLWNQSEAESRETWVVPTQGSASRGYNRSGARGYQGCLKALLCTAAVWHGDISTGQEWEGWARCWLCPFLTAWPWSRQ